MHRWHTNLRGSAGSPGISIFKRPIDLDGGHCQQQDTRMMRQSGLKLLRSPLTIFNYYPIFLVRGKSRSLRVYRRVSSAQEPSASRLARDAVLLQSWLGPELAEALCTEVGQPREHLRLWYHPPSASVAGVGVHPTPGRYFLRSLLLRASAMMWQVDL